ncbi:MAG: hypothetical protein WA738_18495 [Candidatus Angelobacter sp.]
MKLTIEIDLPEAQDILQSGCPVPIARKGVTWKASCLGKMSKGKGVYVIHHANQIVYVGKTEGPTMDFGTRLRREFQETAANGKHIYPKLSLLPIPPLIMAHFYTISEIQQRIKSNEPYRADQLMAVFETAMINHLDPNLQRHFMNATANRIRKVLKVELGREPSEEDFKVFLDGVNANGNKAGS